MVKLESLIVMTWQDMDIGLYGWDHANGKVVSTFRGYLKWSNNLRKM